MSHSSPQNRPRKTEPSKVEHAKQKGDFLRGTIPEVLADSTVDHFEHDDLQLLKFHGTYQQDDRDLRSSRRAEGLDKAYSFMLRVTLPAGQLTAQQYLDLDRMADQYANGTIRLTTRQAIQFHGVLKGNLKSTMASISHSLMTTLAACGDVCRNVMATAAPLEDDVHRTIRETAIAIAADLRPATNAYYEIWLDGERVESTMSEEPFYGETYLPRKFKTGVTIMGDNQIDIYSYDAGLIGIVDGGRLIGFNVVAGGGLGMSHGRENTFAQLAHDIGFVDVQHGVAVIRAIASIYRDYGNRADRKHARLKYLINDRGLKWFQDELQSRCEFEILPAWAINEIEINDWLGRHRQGESTWFYGLFVENGRIKDTPECRMRSAIRNIVAQTGCGITLTAQQSLLFTGLSADQLDWIEATLADHGVPLVDQLSSARRYSMACPALPTCGMAVAESERVAPAMVDQLEQVLRTLGVGDVPLTFRMTGCPNGCARPYTADIALVGRRPNIYHIFVGGRIQGDRVADLYAADVHADDFVPTLLPLLTKWAAERRDGEGLGDFYQRLCGRSQPRQRVTGKERASLPVIQPLLTEPLAPPTDGSRVIPLPPLPNIPTGSPSPAE